jgi:hypothetical protein
MQALHSIARTVRVAPVATALVVKRGMAIPKYVPSTPPDELGAWFVGWFPPPPPALGKKIDGMVASGKREKMTLLKAINNAMGIVMETDDKAGP